MVYKRKETMENLRKIKGAGKSAIHDMNWSKFEHYEFYESGNNLRIRVYCYW